MALVDLVVKNARVVTHIHTLEGVGLAIHDGRFVAIAQQDQLPTAREVLAAEMGCGARPPIPSPLASRRGRGAPLRGTGEGEGVRQRSR